MLLALLRRLCDATCARWQPVRVGARTLLDVLQTITPDHSHRMLHESLHMLLLCQVCKAARAVVRMLRPDVNLVLADKFLCNPNEAVDQLLTLATIFNLRSLSIDNTRKHTWTPASVAKLAHVVGSAPQLVKLAICKQNLQNNDLYALLPAITQNTVLKHLNLEDNKIDHQGLFYLIPSLAMQGGKMQGGMQSLDLRGNPIGEYAGWLMSMGLGNYWCLQHLRLGGCKLGPHGVVHVVNALPACTALVELTLGAVDMQAIGACALWRFARECSTLQVLDVQQNDIKEAGCDDAAYGLRGCARLEDVDMSSNTINARGMRILAHEFRWLTNLKRLNLTHNHIADAATALFGGLQHCALLEILVLDSVRIEDQGATALAGMLLYTDRLRGLYLAGNQIGNPGAARCASVLPNCTSLKQLDLAENSIGDAGVQAIMHAFPDCRALRAVDLQSNEFCTARAQAALRALQPACPQLRCYIFPDESDREGLD